MQKRGRKILCGRDREKETKKERERPFLDIVQKTLIEELKNKILKVFEENVREYIFNLCIGKLPK